MLEDVIITHGPPTPPPGISALVTQAHIIPSPDCIVELRWILSANDPNQVVGQYEYDIYVEGAFSATDTISAEDGDGRRFYQFQIGNSGSNIGNLEFKVKAINTTTEEESTFSDTVSVNCETEGDFDSSGTIGGGGFAGSGDCFFGLCFDYFAEAWDVDSTAIRWLFGMFVIALIVGAFAVRVSGSPIILSIAGMLGVGISVAFGLIPVWFLLVIVFIIVIFLGHMIFGSSSGGED